MYTFVIVSMLCTMVYGWKCIKSYLNRIVIKETVCVGYDGNHRKYEDNEHGVYFMKTYYTRGTKKYCYLGMDVPFIDDLYDDENKKSIKHAEIDMNGIDIDVTDSIIEYAGSYGNFHNSPIDFSWIFPDDIGILNITYNDHPIVKINLKNNKIMTEDQFAVNIVDYITDDSDNDYEMT